MFSGAAADGSEEIASKLKLFNRPYDVVTKQGTRYVLRDPATKKETTAHVSQIARMRSVEDDGAPASPSGNSDDSTQLNLVVGTFCVIWVRTDSRSVLRVLEVLEVNGEEQSFLGWYNIHINSGQFDPEMALLQRRLTPEWAHNRTQKRAKPTAGEEHLYTKIFGEFGATEIEVVVPQFHVQSGGKIPEPVCRKVDTWLRLAMRRSPRAVLALSYPTPQETTKQAAFRRRGVR